MTGSHQLSEFPLEIVRVVCNQCGRSGQYRKETLAARFGADVALPDLLPMVAQCPRHGQLGQACGAVYEDLRRTQKQVPPPGRDGTLRREAGDSLGDRPAL